MKHTFVILWQCYQCGAVADQYDYERGKGCRSCGGHHMKYAIPNFRNKVRYFLGHPKMLLRSLLEKFLARDS